MLKALIAMILSIVGTVGIGTAKPQTLEVSSPPLIGIESPVESTDDAQIEDIPVVIEEVDAAVIEDITTEELVEDLPLEIPLETPVESAQEPTILTGMKLKLSGVTETAIEKELWLNSGVNLRENFTATSKRIATYKTGQKVTAIAETSNGWYKVIIGEKTGYMMKKHLVEEMIEIPRMNEAKIDQPEEEQIEIETEKTLEIEPEKAIETEKKVESEKNVKDSKEKEVKEKSKGKR
ncbi:MAG: SH3 domain-containing protein [Clostridiaceae bacterium]